jgi:two-component system chemotaxis response regulator CheY
MLDTRTPILIIDDYASMRGTLRAMLQHLGLRNISEDDGSRALELVRGHAFGLVISDLVMAPMSGLELLRQVRADSRLVSLPFVLTTAVPDATLVTAAKELAVDGFLVKPFNIETLRRVVSFAVEGRAPARSAAARPDAKSIGETPTGEKPADDAAERARLRKDIATLAEQLERRRALGASLLEDDATGLIKSYMARAVRLRMERASLDQLTGLLKFLSAEPGAPPAEAAIAAVGRVDRRDTERRLGLRPEAEPRRSEAELRRRHRRFVTPILHVELGGRIYRTLDWSIGGLSIGGWAGSLAVGKQLKIGLTIAGMEDPAAFFEDRVTVVAASPESGSLALKFMTHTSAALRVLEYLTKRGEQALEAPTPAAAAQ